jgi:hypothetical protein
MLMLVCVYHKYYQRAKPQYIVVAEVKRADCRIRLLVTNEISSGWIPGSRCRQIGPDLGSEPDVGSLTGDKIRWAFYFPLYHFPSDFSPWRIKYTTCGTFSDLWYIICPTRPNCRYNLWIMWILWIPWMKCCSSYIMCACRVPPIALV